MRKIIGAVNFEDIKSSCGYGSIYNVLKHYGYPYTEYQLYFMCDGFNFEFINSTNQIGYNNISHTCDMLSRFCGVSYSRNDDEVSFQNKIISAIDKGSMVLLYVSHEALEHHKLKTSSYPYHVLIAYGYDTEKFILDVADLYIVSDSGKKSTFKGQLNLETISKYTIDYIVIDNTSPPDADMLKIIDKNLDSYWSGSYQHPLSKFIDHIKSEAMLDINYFSNQLPTLIIPAKWIVFNPFFDNSMKMCIELGDYSLCDKFSDTYTALTQASLRLIKMGYKRNIQAIFETADNIQSIWDDTTKLLKLLQCNIKEGIKNE